jgi:long-chain acyl-CoA synthetase
MFATMGKLLEMTTNNEPRRKVGDFLYTHPGVLDVAVLGERDDLWGQRVVAHIVAKDASLTGEILNEYCKNSEKLAAYKRPSRYVFVEKLPRNASGKIQKFILRGEAAQEKAK